MKTMYQLWVNSSAEGWMVVDFYDDEAEAIEDGALSARENGYGEWYVVRVEVVTCP